MSTKLARPLVVLVMLLAACHPTTSGPSLPRPVPTTTTPVISTSTVPTVAGETMTKRPDCPTVFCLVYHIEAEAEWSDGTPVTAKDFVHTLTVGQERAPESPFSNVTSIEALDERTALVAFDEPYGAWRTLFARVIRSGEEPGAIADISTTGPFRFVEWTVDDHLSIARDPEWWASADPLSDRPLGDIREITFVFIDEPEEMVDALDDGDVDVITTAAPTTGMVEEIRQIEEVELVVAPGPYWEHIGFNHDDPLLSLRWVREAITLAIDREKILDRTVRQIAPDASALDNTVFMSGTSHYEPHFQYGFDPGRAEQILVEEGCIRNEDGIYECLGIPMSFVWAATNDEPHRREIFESAREDLMKVGIEVVPDFRSPSDFVTRDFLFGGPDVWQLIDFSWLSQPEPFSSNSRYYCGDAGDLNVNRYCSPQVERLVRSTDTNTDPVARAAVYNRADRLYLDDLALIPLYQRPTLMAWSSEISGPVANYTLSGDLWNVASWSGKESIVVALPAEPVEMGLLSGADANANLIMGALVYGAYGMSPSHEYIPVLVESVDVIEGTP